MSIYNSKYKTFGQYTDKTPDKRFRTEKTCCRCGIALTEKNWPLNARKRKRHVWYVCSDCFKLAIANNVYKFETGLVLQKRPKSDVCEICYRKQGIEIGRLSWHHWDDSDTSKGLWLCNRCHRIVEIYEQQNKEVLVKYVELKKLLSAPMEVS